ncbi:MAG: GNAT family N-acetyltransferase [Ruminococcaceae bacterium]|nr:GNAT family N-acetyltransferase [Oscillospiraceae bacterium]
MNKILVRAAKPEDANEVYNLLRIIADLHRNGRPDMFPDLISKYTVEELELRFLNDNHGVFVAVNDNRVLGYVFCDIIKEGNGFTLYVDDLCVSPRARKNGIGHMLMDKAVEYGRKSNCSQLMLNVWEFNSSAVDFYEKYGLTTRTRHMEMPL